MKTKTAGKKKIRKSKNDTEVSPLVVASFVILGVAVLIFFISMAMNYNYNIEIINQSQTNYQNFTTTYNFVISNLYPSNLYGELGNGVFANITEYEQYRLLIGKAGSINITFNFPQDADAQVTFNILYLDNNTRGIFVINGLNGTKMISGKTVPSILTITVKNYGKAILNGEINATIEYN